MCPSHVGKDCSSVMKRRRCFLQACSLLRGQFEPGQIEHKVNFSTLFVWAKENCLQVEVHPPNESTGGATADEIGLCDPAAAATLQGLFTPHLYFYSPFSP